MNSTHQLLSLDEVQPGYLLAESILDAEGDVLLPEGGALTAAIIDNLRSRGVATLSILSIPESGASEDGALAERLRHIFRNAGDNLPSVELQRQIFAYRLAKNHD